MMWNAASKMLMGLVGIVVGEGDDGFNVATDGDIEGVNFREEDVVVIIRSAVVEL